MVISLLSSSLVAVYVLCIRGVAALSCLVVRLEDEMKEDEESSDGYWRLLRCGPCRRYEKGWGIAGGGVVSRVRRRVLLELARMSDGCWLRRVLGRGKKWRRRRERGC